ncbi:MAG TPA: hypothetical protein VHE83_16645 [Mycobacteriales bacterium]|nr:hypothetical protein [Mycobacteriales bacterium]
MTSSDRLPRLRMAMGDDELRASPQPATAQPTLADPWAGRDPRHTFLSAREVIARYGWGRTKGYEMLRRPDFPAAVGGDRYRLDALMAWEDAQLAQPRRDPPTIVATFPPRKRPRRQAAG